MALIKCRECGGQVSLKASACPKCGEPPPSPEQLKEENARKMKFLGILIVIGVFLYFGILVKSSWEPNREEEARVAKVEYFSNHTKEILAKMRSILDHRNYDQALALAQVYAFSKNVELLAMEKEAEGKKLRLNNQAAEEKLLAEVKKIPGRELTKNRDIYAKLVSLNQGESLYKRKYDFYQGEINRQEKESKRLEAKREKEKKRLVAKFGRRPIVGPGFSGYNSPQIEIYLRKTAHDPDSIELENCTEVKRTRQGWLVGCTYRGRNGFGGLVKNANWFTIRHEQVVKVEPSSTYSWQ